MTLEWKSRGTDGRKYRARRVSHASNTSIEYGEKTWTTAQTVRDLMQNHLDAETDRYFQQIATVVLEPEALQTYRSGDRNGSVGTFLHALFMYARYSAHMSPSSRRESEKYLITLSKNVPVSSTVKESGSFSARVFKEKTAHMSEQRPHVVYTIRDTKTDEILTGIPYDELATEELLEEKIGSEYRYQIEGFKIADHGSGFDSQLSTLYLSSKGGKKHLRGKFGEGAKMSELHVLRGGGQMKMRSTYVALNGNIIDRARTWQTRPNVQDGRLVSQGVELENVGIRETGSSVQVSLKGAKESFKKDVINNIDPRIGGLGKNIAEFEESEFTYPMPITEPHLTGVNLYGSGDVQYVQGLRVELAKDSFGYAQPWYSYNFLDSSIIGGRDRNEIKAEVQDRIKAFWMKNDDEESLSRLVRDAVKDIKRCGGSKMMETSPELFVLECIIGAHAGKVYLPKSQGEKTQRSVDISSIQAIIDEALLNELEIEDGTEALVIPDHLLREPNLEDVIDHARSNGIAIKTTAAHIGDHALSAWKKRLPKTYTVLSLSDIRKRLAAERKHDEDYEEDIESGKERALREVFNTALANVNALVVQAGFAKRDIKLQFKTPPKPKKTSRGGRSRWGDDDRFGDDDDPSAFRPFNERAATIQITWQGAIINPEAIDDPKHYGAENVQRQIEIHLLAAFNREDTRDIAEGLVSKEDVMKSAQRFLDTLITKLIPNNHPLLTAIPDTLNYEKDPELLMRLVQNIMRDGETKREDEMKRYEQYLRSLSLELTPTGARELLAKINNDSNAYAIKKVLKSRVFFSQNELVYYNDTLRGSESRWVTIDTSKMHPAAEWRGHPVYVLQDGRYFIPASMRGGAVLAKGEGKKREYTFSQGETFMHIGETSVSYGTFDAGWSGSVAPHPDGLIITRPPHKDVGMSAKDYVAKELNDYTYFPTGKSTRAGKIEKGVSTTSIPIEYGRDEWDNPVRVFQDIVQNHVDAADAAGVSLRYEVERDGSRVWVDTANVRSTDVLSGLMVEDNGGGYFPNDIATMGASSKKSPLFAGKYGEGQKIVAAAALRNGLELSYTSTVNSGDTLRSWSAQAVPETRAVVLDGQEVSKQLVAFNVDATDATVSTGSRTVLRLPLQPSPAQLAQWNEWVSIIDPRQKENSKHGGLARYIRQLRAPGSERIEKVGSVEVLLDEPGAVYENGLRINAQVEKGRKLSYGYDVPEIVTTRERNSYNAGRLNGYVQHALSHMTNPAVIEEILKNVASRQNKDDELKIGQILSSGTNAAPVWAGVAQKIWPNFVVHSSEAMQKDIEGDEFPAFDEDSKRREKQRRGRALKLQANLRHLDRSRMLDVPQGEFYGYSRLLPTAESVVDNIGKEAIPAPASVATVLGTVVAQSTKVFTDIIDRGNVASPGQAIRNSLPAERVRSKALVWSNADDIVRTNKVGIAPVDSAFHGRAEEKGVVFNEALLFKGKKRDLAETSLHEIAHVVTGYSDYTEEFVGAMYEVAQHFTRAK